MKKIILLISIAILTATTANATRWYVDAESVNGTPVPNSHFTQNPCNDLQLVINTAVSGDEIWVKGFINPTSNQKYSPSLDSIVFSPWNKYYRYTFDTKDKDLKIYGGFRGDEQHLSDRKYWREYESVLRSAPSSTNNLIDLNGSNAVLDGFTIKDNQIDHVLIWVGGSSGEQILSNLIIKGNSSNYEAILCSEGYATTKLFNVEFSFNTFSANSSLISNLGTTMELYNVTFAWNNRSAQAPPAFKVHNANFHIYNSIIWKTGGYDYSTGNASLTNCMTEVAYPGALPAAVVQTNIITTANPGFVNNTFLPTGDFHLNSSSPAIDAGSWDIYDNAYTPYTTNPLTDFWARDLDGKLRLMDNEIDLGPYEYGAIVFYAPRNLSKTKKENQEEMESSPIPVGITLYPTLVHKAGTIHIDNVAKNAIVRVYSVNGTCVTTQTVTGNAAITAPGNEGIYMVTVSATNGETLYKGKIVVTL